MSEYWIQNDGYLVSADVDIDDISHENVVYDSIKNDIVYKCQQKYKSLLQGNFSEVDYFDWDEFQKALLTAYEKVLFRQRPLFTKKWVQNQVRGNNAFLLPAYKFAGVTKIELDVVDGKIDARDYAMEKWGWKTYRDGHIDTWFFRPADLQAIVTGIDEISNEQDWSDTRLNRESFTINVFSTGKHFNLTYKQMKNPNSRKATSASPETNNLISYGTNNASKQVRDIDIQNIHPAYKRQGVNPLGDSVLSFKAFLEMALGTQYWYHITYAKNLSGIRVRGIVKNANPNWKHGGYDSHSQEGIFVTQPKLVSYWISRFSDLAEHNSDNIYKDKLIPIILRFTLHEDKLNQDKMANDEDKIYGKKRISPNRIEMWTGKEWRKEISLVGIKASDFLEKDEHGISFKYNYPLPPEI